MIRVTLKRAAQRRGFDNPKQLADEMGCAPTIIWRIWNGIQMPGLEMLDRICEALRCDLDELITRTARTKSPARKSGAKKK